MGIEPTKRLFRRLTGFEDREAVRKSLGKIALCQWICVMRCVRQCVFRGD